MITHETELLTKQYRKEHSFKKNIKGNKNSSILDATSYLVAIPYGLCYFFLTYTLLQYAYTLFLSALFQTIFFVVIPAWTLIIPAIMTGTIYFLIGQHEINILLKKNFLNVKRKEDTSLLQSITLLILGLFVGVFIGLEFFEFLPLSFPIAVSIAIFGGFTHFTLFFNNAGASIKELSKLFDKTGGENNIEYFLDMLSLAAPILAIIHVIFITGLFHPIVFTYFAIGVSAVFIKKWMDYDGLSLFRRFFATVDATIREYAALIVHCIGEGAIPAAAATHASSSSGVFFAQLSGLVATSNEYFTDLHAVTGDKHYYRIFKNERNDNIYLCEVAEDKDFNELDSQQSFFFSSNDDNDLQYIALKHLNNQFNGVFEFVRNSQPNLCIFQNIPHSQKLKLTFIEALLGVKLKKTINYTLNVLTFIFLTAIFSLITLSYIHVLPFALSVIALPILFVVYRYAISYFTGLEIIKLDNNDTLQCSDMCCPPHDNLQDDGHSHGLNYKPTIKYLFGFSTTFNNILHDASPYPLVLQSLMMLSIVLASLTFVYVLPFGILHQLLLLPIIYCLFAQSINFFTWLNTTDSNTKKIDLCIFLSNYLNPLNWLKGLCYISVCLVAFCIGINGGTEFVHHLSFMFAASSVALPVIIGIFILSALLTEGVWINDRLEKAFKPLQSFFFDSSQAGKPIPSNDMTKVNNVPGSFKRAR